MTKDDLLLAELRKHTKLLACIATQSSQKNKKEQIALLANAGFPPKEIAEFVGSTPNAVSVTLLGLRKKTKQNHKTKP